MAVRRPVLIAIIGEQVTSIEVDSSLVAQRIGSETRTRSRVIEGIDIHPEWRKRLKRHDLLAQAKQRASPVVGMRARRQNGGDGWLPEARQCDPRRVHGVVEIVGGGLQFQVGPGGRVHAPDAGDGQAQARAVLPDSALCAGARQCIQRAFAQGDRKATEEIDAQRGSILVKRSRGKQMHRLEVLRIGAVP